MRSHQERIKQLSACLIALNRHQEVEVLIKKYLKHDDGDGDLRYYLSLNYAREGKTEEALNELKVVLENGKGNEAAKKLAFKLLTYKAGLKIKNKDWKEASSALTLAIKYAPNTPDARKELSRFRKALPISYLKSGQREEAAEIWEEELRKNPSDLNLMHNLALLYYWWTLNLERENKNGSALEGINSDTFDRLWRKSIAYWTTLVHMDYFWKEWKGQREESCSIQINEEDIETLRHKFIEERFSKVFHDYIDHYKLKGSLDDSDRHEEYLTTLLLEAKSSACWKDALSIWRSTLKINIDKSIKRYELIRAIQEVEDGTACFGTDENCKTAKGCHWGRYCQSDRNRELFFNIPAGYQFFQECDMLLEAQKLIEILYETKPDHESIEKLRIYLHPQKLGRILVLIEERKNPEKAINEWQKLSEKVRNSVEGRYLYVLALIEKGRESSEQKDGIHDALNDWSIAKEDINKTIWIDTYHPFNKLLDTQQKKIDELVIEACEREAKKLKQAVQIDQAIRILEKGIKMTNNSSLKEHLSIFYCDEGDKKLKDKQFSAARGDFEKALSYNPGYIRAKRGIGTTYNNEAIDKNDPRQSIPLLETAMSYDSDSEVIKENLAGMYNQKAVEIVNSLNQYSDYQKFDEPVELLRKAARLLNPNVASDALDSLAHIQEWQLNDLKLPEGLYKTVLRNLWIASSGRRYRRGY